MRAKFAILLLIPALAATEDTIKLATYTEFVVEAVTVKDKHGKPVEGLKAEDFAVTYDGKPQAINFFEPQRLEGPIDRAADTLVVEPLVHNYIEVERPGALRYPNRRLLALYFDLTAMPAPDRLRAFDAARHFIRYQMAAADSLTIMQFTEAGLQVLTDFTADRDRLLKAMDNLVAGDDASGALSQDDEFDAFSFDRQLTALQNAARMLASLNERKSSIYFASGLSLGTTYNRAQLKLTLNAAGQSNVAIYPIDAHGSQEVLNELASGTGGKALLHSGNLGAGIVRAQEAASDYYLLGYYNTNHVQDGKFRHINISLKNRSAKVEYRQGVYFTPPFLKFTADNKEGQLHEALMLENPAIDVPVAAEVDHFQLSRSEYLVPLTVKIPGFALVRAKREGNESAMVDFIGEVKDNQGRIVHNVRDNVIIEVSGRTSAQLFAQPIEYDTSFTLAPGAYTIKLLARVAETGQIGTYLNQFVIPDLSKEKNLAISSVILSSRRANDGKPIPNVTRVFKRDQSLYVYLQAYQRAAAPVSASVSLYRGQTKAFETALDTQSNSAPLRFSISLKDLPPGIYDCRVKVEDLRHHTAFWQAPIMVQQ